MNCHSRNIPGICRYIPGIYQRLDRGQAAGSGRNTGPLAFYSVPALCVGLSLTSTSVFAMFCSIKKGMEQTHFYFTWYIPYIWSRTPYAFDIHGIYLVYTMYIQFSLGYTRYIPGIFMIYTTMYLFVYTSHILYNIYHVCCIYMVYTLYMFVIYIGYDCDIQCIYMEYT